MPDLVKGYVINGKADAAIIYRSCMAEVHKPGQGKPAANEALSQKLQDIGLIDPKLYTPFQVMAVVPVNAPDPRPRRSSLMPGRAARGSNGQRHGTACHRRRESAG